MTCISRPNIVQCVRPPAFLVRCGSLGRNLPNTIKPLRRWFSLSLCTRSSVFSHLWLADTRGPRPTTSCPERMDSCSPRYLHAGLSPSSMFAQPRGLARLLHAQVANNNLRHPESDSADDLPRVRDQPRPLPVPMLAICRRGSQSSLSLSQSPGHSQH